MATHAIVGMQIDNGEYRSVYTHSDGYPSHHLPILVNHYNTKEKVRELLSHGDISILAENCDGADGVQEEYLDKTGLIVKHSFDTPVKGQTVYYGRDRGDRNVKAIISRSFNNALKRFGQEEYGYVFKDGEWFVVNGTTLNHFGVYLKDGEFQDDPQ